MNFRFHPEALTEYKEAALYYAERQPGLEFRFIESVESAIQAILETPARWRILEQDVRYCQTKVFPYAVLYTVESDYVLLVAVMHSAREPGYWRARIQSSGSSSVKTTAKK